MPEVIIVAGPNGAGKTSFAHEYIQGERPDLVFVNADEIARALAEPPLARALRDQRAGRLMIEEIDALVKARLSFMFETTLSSLMYARKIVRWRELGYRVALTYLRLPSVEISIQRVARRVAAGGHGIEEHIIRRRFGRSIEYFDGVYKSIVDEWHLWDSLENEFRLIDSRVNE